MIEKTQQQLERYVPWTFWDIILVQILMSIAVFFVVAVVFPFLNIEIGKTAHWQIVALYLFIPMMFFSPVLLIRQKYNLTITALGIHKGRYSSLQSLAIGFVAAVIGGGITYSYLFWGPIKMGSFFGKMGWWRILFFPVTPIGLAYLFGQSISDEIMKRGFIYGFLRYRIGIFWGILTQALLCTIISIVTGSKYTGYLFISGFLSEVISGLLYEKADNLYAGMCFNGFINFFFVVITSSPLSNFLSK